MASDVQLEQVPIKDLKPAPENPRKPGDVKDLAASIKEVGVLEPLIATKNGDGKYEVVAGIRRLKAAKEAGLTEVPVLIRDLEPSERLEIVLIENLQREDLTPIEEAQTYQRLLEEAGYSQRKLADRVGISQSNISKRLSLLVLPEKDQKRVVQGELAVTDAVEFARLEDPKVISTAIKEFGDTYVTDARAFVDRIQRDLDQERKVIEAEEAATTKGLKLLSRDEWYRSPGNKIRVVGKNVYYANRMEHVDPKKHASEPCAAVGIDPNTAEIIPLCTEPKNHPTPEGAPQAKSEKAAASKAADDKALRMADKARTAFIADMIQHRVPAAERQRIIVGALVETANDSLTRKACRFLGIWQKGMDSAAQKKALRQLTEKGGEQEARAGLAVAMAFAENRFDGVWEGQRSEFAEHHLKMLETLGYAATREERAHAAGKGPR